MIEEEGVPKDYLTGLLLRDSFYSHLKRFIFEGESKNKRFSILIFDVDHFKHYNDRYGHLFGDDLLKYVADKLQLFFPQDQCFRYGGDEFIVLLADKNPDEVYELVSEFKDGIAKSPFLFEDMTYKPFKISLSCGIAGYPSDGKTVGEMIKKGDEALYFSKHHGRNRVTLSGKIKYIKLRHLFIKLASACVVLGLLFMSYQLYLKEYIYGILRTVKDIRKIQIITEEQIVDTIILKNGRIIKGKITDETATKVMLNIPLEAGMASMVLKKSEIAEIKYSSGRVTK